MRPVPLSHRGSLWCAAAPAFPARTHTSQPAKSKEPKATPASTKPSPDNSKLHPLRFLLTDSPGWFSPGLLASAGSLLRLPLPLLARKSRGSRPESTEIVSTNFGRSQCPWKCRMRETKKRKNIFPGSSNERNK